jgi:hypothetical protein
MRRTWHSVLTPLGKAVIGGAIYLAVIAALAGAFGVLCSGPTGAVVEESERAP